MSDSDDRMKSSFHRNPRKPPRKKIKNIIESISHKESDPIVACGDCGVARSGVKKKRKDVCERDIRVLRCCFCSYLEPRATAWRQRFATKACVRCQIEKV